MPDHCCERCNRTFRTSHLLAAHTIEEPGCKAAEPHYQEQITSVQEKLLRKRHNGNDTEGEWFRIFKILFPSAALPHSPYFSNSGFAIDDFLTFFEQQAPTVLSSFLREQLSENTIPIDRQRVLDEALNHATAELMKAFASRTNDAAVVLGGLTDEIPASNILQKSVLSFQKDAETACNDLEPVSTSGEAYSTAIYNSSSIFDGGEERDAAITYIRSSMVTLWLERSGSLFTEKTDWTHPFPPLGSISEWTDSVDCSQVHEILHASADARLESLKGDFVPVQGNGSPTQPPTFPLQENISTEAGAQVTTHAFDLAVNISESLIEEGTDCNNSDLQRDPQRAPTYEPAHVNSAGVVEDTEPRPGGSNGTPRYTTLSDREANFMGISSPEFFDDDFLERLIPRPTLEEIHSRVVSGYLQTVFSADSDFRVCPSEEPSDQQNPSGGFVGIAQLASLSVGSSKRKNCDESKEDEQDDDQRKRRKKFVNLPIPDGETRRTLACPYTKYDHARYSEENILVHEMPYRRCSTLYAQTIPTIKQHLYWCHRRPEFHCDICYLDFPSDRERAIHNRSRSCHPRPCPFEERMDADQYNKVKERWYHEDSVTSWFKIYSILFPGKPVPDSPYANDFWQQQAEPFAEYYAVHAPAVYDEIMPERLDVQFPDLARDTRAALNASFQHALQDVLRELAARHRAEMTGRYYGHSSQEASLPVFRHPEPTARVASEASSNTPVLSDDVSGSERGHVPQSELAANVGVDASFGIYANLESLPLSGDSSSYADVPFIVDDMCQPFHEIDPNSELIAESSQGCGFPPLDWDDFLQQNPWEDPPSSLSSKFSNLDHSKGKEKAK
jgi:hypothetical protein